MRITGVMLTTWRQLFFYREETLTKETTKTIEFTRNTMAGGKPVKVGDIATLPVKEAQLLIHIGKAVEVIAAEAAAPAKAPAKKKDEKTEGPAADNSPFDGMSVNDLKGFAATNEIKLPAGAKKAEMIAAIKAAMAGKTQADNDQTQDDAAADDDEGEGTDEGEDNPENQT